MGLALILFPIIMILIIAYYLFSIKVVQVHMVPHSHDDLGWLKTPKEYYYGEAYKVRNACVRDVITSVYENLV